MKPNIGKWWDRIKEYELHINGDQMLDLTSRCWTILSASWIPMSIIHSDSKLFVYVQSQFPEFRPKVLLDWHPYSLAPTAQTLQLHRPEQAHAHSQTYININMCIYLLLKYTHICNYIWSYMQIYTYNNIYTHMFIFSIYIHIYTYLYADALLSNANAKHACKTNMPHHWHHRLCEV